MAETSVQKLQKPVLRGLLHKKAPFLIVSCLIFSAVAGVVYRSLVGSRRKAIYAEFYKNYDAEKAFERMKAKGVFKNV